MARRRLNTILATTTLAAGLTVAPAFGQSLDDVTDTVEATVEETEDTTETVTTTVETATDVVTAGPDAQDDGDASTLDTDDAPTSEVTEDAPIDADLEVDVAPEDEDGSPQLEVDGGVTVGDETIDIGSTTDPIEETVDPDPAPADSDDGTPSGETDQPRSHSGPGGFLPGGGVTAAGDQARPAQHPGSNGGGGDPAGSAVGESFAAFAAGNRGSDLNRGTTADGIAPDSSQVLPPEVAPGAPLDGASGTQVEQPAVMATPAAAGEPADQSAALLKSLAALMVLGTGLVLRRNFHQA